MAQVKQFQLRRTPLEPAYVALRQFLVTARTDAGLTQDELAQRLGKPQSFVAKYEVGERYIDAVEIVALAALLKFDVLEINELVRSALNS